MTRIRNRLATCLAGGLLVLAVRPLALAGAATGDGAPQPFVVSGTVDGLYPGGTVTLNLQVANPNDIALDLTSITATVSAPSAGTCDASNVSFAGFSGHRVVPARETVTVPTDITMSRAAPDACQGVTFALSFSGSSATIGDATAASTNGGPSDLARTGANGLDASLSTAYVLLAVGGLLIVVSRRSSRPAYETEVGR